MRHEIRRIVDDAQITTIYVTHDQEEALSLADQMAVLRDGLLVQAGPPRELYEAPNSKFTASFLGETNFLEGTIESIERDSTVVTTPLGRLRSARCLEKSSPGDEISVSLRPEAFRLQSPPQDWNRFSTTLRRSMFLGESAQLEVETASESRLKVLELHPRTDRSKGETIELAIDPADVVLLPE